MIDDESHIAKALELYFDWNIFRSVELDIQSDNINDEHIVRLYRNGRLLHGWILKAIK